MDNLKFKAAVLTVAILLTGSVAVFATYKIVTILTITQFLTLLGIAACGFLVYVVYKIVLSRLIYEKNNQKM
jgi:hypothetical protein